MLKAVRLDEFEHKNLLEFIANYKDSRNKRNESEAIRSLMIKGFEALQNPVQPQPILDVDKLKAELFQQIMSSIQPIKVYEQYSPMPVNPDFIAKMKPIEQDNNEFIHVNAGRGIGAREAEVQKFNNGEEEPSKPVAPTNPLVANMLANRKR